MIKKRSVGISILLSFITCGIYSLFWMAFLSNETSEYLQEQQSGVTEVILGIITCGLYFIYWNYKMGKRIYDIQQRAGILATDNSLIYLIISLFGFSIIPVWIIQSDFNKLLPDA
ncbi:DUF4234 domain-containing protein [Clostridium weizhouense]|uniref:DUF4234 domain-containing protein n=1 Tax=Clostridium weizhouense TaxID=2859781 RepID=A0ABS7ALE5_9CLOT|nr:DUF4234 domain-containing protein [Clostridium weizhouense]MBW6409462.1 DUF4234 domain-containing protein [Clostridium weizhouense]